MILERKHMFNSAFDTESIAMPLGGLDDLFGSPQQIVEALNGIIYMQQLYGAAMREISTKLEILDDEFHVKYAHNPVHHIESRLKHPRSIFAKLAKRGLPLSIEAAMENLTDIAGIRVICNYIDDVYAVAKLFSKQDDITLLRKTDYIAQPKPNGYRSLHAVVSVPVFLSGGKEHVPVEIQMRTIAMDFWASLEHDLHYKAPMEIDGQLKAQLLKCAEGIAEIDGAMQEVHRKIHQAE